MEYKSGSSARRAAYKADKITIDDRKILVDMECERELKGTHAIYVAPHLSVPPSLPPSLSLTPPLPDTRMAAHQWCETTP